MACRGCIGEQVTVDYLKTQPARRMYEYSRHAHPTAHDAPAPLAPPAPGESRHPAGVRALAGGDAHLPLTLALPNTPQNHPYRQGSSGRSPQYHPGRECVTAYEELRPRGMADSRSHYAENVCADRHRQPLTPAVPDGASQRALRLWAHPGPGL